MKVNGRPTLATKNTRTSTRKMVKLRPTVMETAASEPSRLTFRQKPTHIGREVNLPKSSLSRELIRRVETSMGIFVVVRAAYPSMTAIFLHDSLGGVY